MQIQFLGGVQTVTGSKFLVTTGKHRFLVDCGLFQGVKELRLRNRHSLPVLPQSVDAVLLTHAHLDHSGYLPLLVKEGFRGRIYSTGPTRDLCRVILADSARLQVEDAGFANKHGYSKHHPAEPLYCPEDADRAMGYFRVVPTQEWQGLPGGARFRLRPSGHMLGSTFVELEAEGKRVVFTGDLGRSRPLLYEPAERIAQADYLVVESTYGDRVHEADPDGATTLERLSAVTTATVSRGGHLLIPSFAVGRAQELMLLFSRLKARSMIPDVPIYLDSPMGLEAMRILGSHDAWHALSGAEVDAMWDVVKVIRSQQESIEVMRASGPAVVIAGSGMAAGGRILHHLASKLPDPRSTVLLVGYQAAGTRGRLLKDGAPDLKMHGKYVGVRARIEEITGLSAHADQSEILAWLKGFERAPRQTFIVHGEPQASDTLRVKIKDVLGWDAVVPSDLQQCELE